MNFETKEHQATTTLSLAGKEFNLNLLIKALSRANIKIRSLDALNSTIGAEKRSDTGALPMESATLIVDAPEEAVREALAHTEFHGDLDAMFGQHLN